MIIIGFLWWLIILPVNITFLIICYLIAPVLPFFCNSSGWLPAWLSWFQTPDNSCDGDSGWKTEHWQWRYRLPSNLAEYVGRVGWLWRNPGYGFDVSVAGTSKILDKVIWYGSRPGGDTEGNVSGWMFGRVGMWWCIFCRKGTCRIYLGWKLPAPQSGKCQYVCSVSLFK